jgi:hypothetical protein
MQEGVKTMKHVRILCTLGAVLVLLAGGFSGGSVSKASALSFDFTYTASDTSQWGYAGEDTLTYEALLTNTGTEIDSYLVTLTKTPGTPTEWTWELCAGGVCQDMITQAVAYLEPGWQDDEFLNVALTVVGKGTFILTAQSYNNPATKMTKSIHFVVDSRPRGPVTDRWGVLALVSLLLLSGLYLIRRRLIPARHTNG